MEAPLTPFCVGIHVKVLAPGVEAVSGSVRGTPLHTGAAGAVVVTTGSGFTVTAIGNAAPVQPCGDFAVMLYVSVPVELFVGFVSTSIIGPVTNVVGS